MSSPKIFEKYTFKETENEVTDLLNVITIVFLSLPLSLTYRLEHKDKTRRQNYRNQESNGLRPPNSKIITKMPQLEINALTGTDYTFQCSDETPISLSHPKLSVVC